MYEIAKLMFRQYTPENQRLHITKNNIYLYENKYRFFRNRLELSA